MCFLLLASSFYLVYASTVLKPVFKHPASTRLPSVSGGRITSLSIPTASYDEQLGLTFTQDFTNMTYNVTAVDQADSYGYGPAYLLNGLSTSGYWYQVGLSYNWPYTNGGYDSGFHFVYEVFNSHGVSVFPSNGGGGSMSFSGPINSGDTILLNLYFSGGSVVMYAQDWTTSASARKTYNARGTTSFVGLLSFSNGNGFFTGLMTEWYHVDPNSGNEEEVNYSNYGYPLSSAWMWMDEYNPSDLSWTGWSDSTPNPVHYSSNSDQLQSFSSHGATESSNAHVFLTGAATMHSIGVGVNMSKTIVGAGYSADITAVMTNYGDFNEVFNVTVYVNDTALETQTVTLANQSSTILSIIWNTMGYAYGHYMISTYVELAPGQINTANRASAYGPTSVSIPGDLNGDFSVNLVDLVMFANAYSSKPGNSNWNSNADVSDNGIVDLSDLVILFQHYGQYWL